MKKVMAFVFSADFIFAIALGALAIYINKNCQFGGMVL